MTADRSERDEPGDPAPPERRAGLGLGRLPWDVGALLHGRSGAAVDASSDEDEALRRERDAWRREAEERSAALEVARARHEALADELVVLKDHAADLEQQLRELLGSTTWRAMEPVRRAMRLVRRQGAPVYLGSRRATSPVADQAHEIIRLSGRIATRDLLARTSRLAAEPDTSATFFLSRLTSLLAFDRVSACAEVAAIVDEVRGRLGHDLRWIDEQAGPEVLLRFTGAAATSLTRVGRYEDARRLLDAVILRQGRQLPALLRHRAAMCWPHDPARARADLEECARRGALDGDGLVLQAHLERQAGALRTRAPAPDPRAARQVRLVHALAALDRGEFRPWREALNAVFEDQGLLAPIPADALRFDFAHLDGHPEAERRRDGPLVSVIMTAFDSARTVGYAVRSVLAQTHANLELLVVDDLSADDTPRLLAGLAATDPRVRVLRGEANVGTYLAKNRAMEQVGGAFVTFHDADDWAHPERLARHVALMQDNPRLVASRSEWLRVGEGGEVGLHRWGHRFQHLNPASMFLRREAIERAGFFDGVRFGADTEYWHRLWHVFGGSRLETLRLCLGLGAAHDASLTRSGHGAMGAETYSPLRGAYAAGFTAWHAAASPEELRQPAAPAGRAFPVPPEMLAGPA